MSSNAMMSDFIEQEKTMDDASLVRRITDSLLHFIINKNQNSSYILFGFFVNVKF
jgi:hypothetical protein